MAELRWPQACLRIRGGDTSEAARDALATEVPLGHLVAPENVAAAAAYLASDDAAMITGTCLAVDVGRCT